MTVVADQLLAEETLMQTFGIAQRALLRRYLDDLRIPYKLLPNGRIFSTLSSINMRLHGYGQNTEEKQINDEFA